MYDAKKLSESEMEKHFECALNSIAGSLVKIHEICDFDGSLMQECTHKITDHLNSLPAGQATELLEGLSQIMTILSNRIMEVDILTRFLADPEFVPSTALVKIAFHPLLQESCNLPEVLIPCVPEHLRPEE